MAELNETTGLLIEVIEKTGAIYAKDTPECIIFLNEHPNCLGCPTKLACDKLLRMMLVTMMPMMYTPKDFDDFQKVHNRVNELTNLILGAKTVDELENIPDF